MCIRDSSQGEEQIEYVETHGRFRKLAERSGFETYGSNTERRHRKAARFRACRCDNWNIASQRKCGVKKRGEIQERESTSLSWAVSAQRVKRSPHLRNRNLLNPTFTVSEKTEIFSIKPSRRVRKRSVSRPVAAAFCITKRVAAAFCITKRVAGTHADVHSADCSPDLPVCRLLQCDLCR